MWGVRPPALGQQPYGQQPYDRPMHAQQPYDQQGQAGSGASGPSEHLDKGFSALQRSPLRRDTDNGVIGGVCAGIAKQLGVSAAAVRIAAVVLAFVMGSGLAAYLIAWALLPDESGSTHAEKGVRGGSTGSLVLLGIGAIAFFGIVGNVLDGLGWLLPVAVTAAIVGYVVYASKGKGTQG